MMLLLLLLLLLTLLAMCFVMAATVAATATEFSLVKGTRLLLMLLHSHLVSTLTMGLASLLRCCSSGVQRPPKPVSRALASQTQKFEAFAAVVAAFVF